LSKDSSDNNNQNEIQETDINIQEKEPVYKEISSDNDNPFKSAKLYRTDVDVKDDQTVVTLYSDEKRSFTRKFVDVGLRTKSPAKLIINLPRTKIADNVNNKQDVGSRHLNWMSLTHGILSGDLVVKFELADNSAYDIKQIEGKTIVRFYDQGANPSYTEIKNEKSLKQKIRIVVDPGHGGEDNGAVGPSGIKEKDITLAISKKLAVLLKKELNAEVYMTRSVDKDMALEKRTEFANAKKADIFLSIHTNAVKDRNVLGIETYYLNNATDEAAKRLAKTENLSASKPQDEVDKILLTLLQNYNTEQSNLLGQVVHAQILAQLAKKYSNVHDRKLRSALFYVLVGAKCPGILIETSYISNQLEEKRLANIAYQRQLVDAIISGVKKYIESNQDQFVSL